VRPLRRACGRGERGGSSYFKSPQETVVQSKARKPIHATEKIEFLGTACSRRKKPVALLLTPGASSKGKHAQPTMVSTLLKLFLPDDKSTSSLSRGQRKAQHRNPHPPYPAHPKRFQVLRTRWFFVVVLVITLIDNAVQGMTGTHLWLGGGMVSGSFAIHSVLCTYCSRRQRKFIQHV